MVNDTGSGMVCFHLSHPLPASCLCVPLLAQGEILGVLTLTSTASTQTDSVQPDGELTPFPETKLQLATATAEHGESTELQSQ